MVRAAVQLILVMLLAGANIGDKVAAQQFENLSALNRQVGELRRAGRYSEAIPIARRGLAFTERQQGPHHPDVAFWLNILALLHKEQGLYADAEPLYKRSLAIREKAQGSDHLDVATSLNNIATLYGAQGRYADAEPLLKRSLVIQEKALGGDHPDVATSLSNLATLHEAQGRHADAEPLHVRSLSILEKALGGNHPRVAAPLNNIAMFYAHQGRYGDAEPLFKRSLAIREKALGGDHPDVAISLSNLATLYHTQGRYGDAEPLHKRSLSIWEKVLGAHHPNVAFSLNNLGVLYQDQGRYADAELLYKRSLAIREKALGGDHPDVAASLSNLAELFRTQGRNADAEMLHKRSLAIREQVLGPHHPSVSTALNNLAELYRGSGRYAEAEVLHKRSLAIREKVLGGDHPDVAISLNNLALIYRREGRYADAETLLKRSLSITKQALGPDHPQVAAPLNNLAALYDTLGRYEDAEALYKSSLLIDEKARGADHPQIAVTLSNLAILHFAQQQWAKAAAYWRQGAELMVRRSIHGADVVGKALTGYVKSDAQREGYLFRGLVKAIHRAAMENPAVSPDLTNETFVAAQWAHGSEAAASLALIAVRSAKGHPQLAGLVRERQDLVSEWQTKDKLLIAAKGEAPAKRKAAAEQALADRLAAIDGRLAEIDRRLALDFPDYAALASPAPVSVAEVQAQLGADEALVLFLDTHEWSHERRPLPEETFIWVVTKSDVRWVRSDLGTAALTREVTALRCGLDATAWDGDGRDKCTKALGVGLTKPLPFDHARAHKLYATLFGEVEDLIKGKHVLIVPSGPLTQLPFQVLVASPPTSTDHRAVAWLARNHAITVLPAVSSLKALRRVGKPSTAPRPMIGFGNPLLDGPDARFASLARLAREKQRCLVRPQHLAARRDHRASPSQVETRGGLANVSVIKGQVPLPETADELCAVAQDVKAEAARDILLGAKATEREVKRLSAAGELAKYRMLHFATHGFLSGQLDGTHEPGLILTPPGTATEEDDGYLSASEIAALKLDADLVILSACNTAAGAATSAEALSGLARAFIYAQARALLVSHWEVYSDAAVKLITTTVREMARDPKVGRSEGLRRAMLALIDNGAPDEAHPAYWAPFVVVGEGAATAR